MGSGEGLSNEVPELGDEIDGGFNSGAADRGERRGRLRSFSERMVAEEDA